MIDSAGNQKKESQTSIHEINITSRKHMKITGVKEVIGFDGYFVELETLCGHLYIDGENIKIGTLDTDVGVVELDGNISALTYSNDDGKEKKSIFKRSR